MAGTFGYGAVVALDGQGEILAYGVGEPTFRPAADACPGGRVVVEVVAEAGRSWIQLRDVATLAAVKTHEEYVPSVRSGRCGVSMPRAVRFSSR